jgi:hypothetical protein
MHVELETIHGLSVSLSEALVPSPVSGMENKCLELLEVSISKRLQRCNFIWLCMTNMELESIQHIYLSVQDLLPASSFWNGIRT